MPVFLAVLAVPRARLYILLAGSLFFYGYWDEKILLLLILTVIINYFAARNFYSSTSAREGNFPDPKAIFRRKALLFIAVAANLSFLGFFKYFNFFAENLNRIFFWLESGGPIPVLDILLPVGISFYTFQITTYTVDVYRKRIPCERSFLYLLLFSVYFPQLVAGPIERAERLIPLFRQKIRPSLEQIHSGMLLAMWGFFKKVFIADNLSPLVDIILFADADPPALAYPFAAVIFAVQIYTDFSGYTDVARGISRMLGIELTLNFNLPFMASNPAEFWHRWHITLGAFLRDYLYIPLGGNRTSQFRSGLNVMIVWTLGGLWHGASIGFLVWGVYCGMLVVLYHILKPYIEKFHSNKAFRKSILLYSGRIFTFLTFGHGLLLFRVDSPAHLWHVIVNIWPDPSRGFLDTGFFFAALFYIWPLIIMQIFQVYRKDLEFFTKIHPAIQGILVAFGLILFILFGAFRADEFFYFQF